MIVAATSNIDDAETNVGFEWRRTDWTDDFASNWGQAFLYEGTMEGYIRNLNADKLWKYRPYYESASGQQYYGEWIGLDPSNTSYFEPTVHTYAQQVVNGNTAQVRGYAMRGSDNAAQQGFKYWKSTNNAQAMASGVSVPKDAQTVEAKGVVMEAELTGLDYSSTYCYVAFVTTTEGETFYGEQQTLQTGEDVTGIETPIMATANDGMLRIYSLNGRMVATQQGGSVETLLTGLRPGLYIVSNGQKAWKVLK
ncbi:MAG: T9SS type A sorting domain-containing protein [Prevotella sp.]|nr:T9SS type A sorting domain-containing protein [Prevotella sp.]